MHAHIYDHAMENINLIQSIPEEIPALNQITAESIAVVLFLNDRGES
jgi:thymidylate synthase